MAINQLTCYSSYLQLEQCFQFLETMGFPEAAAKIRCWRNYDANVSRLPSSLRVCWIGGSPAATPAHWVALTRDRVWAIDQKQPGCVQVFQSKRQWLKTLTDVLESGVGRRWQQTRKTFQRAKRKRDQALTTNTPVAQGDQLFVCVEGDYEFGFVQYECWCPVIRLATTMDIEIPPWIGPLQRGRKRLGSPSFRLKRTHSNNYSAWTGGQGWGSDRMKARTRSFEYHQLLDTLVDSPYLCYEMWEIVSAYVFTPIVRSHSAEFHKRRKIEHTFTPNEVIVVE